MVNVNHHIKTICIIGITVFSIGYVLEFFRVGSSPISDYFQISTELLPLVLTFSIFVIIWFLFKENRDNHSLFIGLVFFIVGLLDLYHILSYPFMPDFITPNSLHKSQIFWGEARLVAATLFLISVYVNNETFTILRKRPLFVASATVISFSFISLITAGIYPEYFPLLTTPEGEPTKEKMMLLFLSAQMLIYTTYLYTQRMHKSGNRIILCLIYGFVLTAFSDLSYLFFEYPGHLLKAAGLYFFYLGMFKTSVEIPYDKMVEAEEKRVREAEERYRNLFDSANDAIIITDLDNRVTSWNKSAERIFGWSEKEILGKNFLPMSLEQILRPEKENINGNIISDSTVTGIETVLPCKDGKSISVSVTISPLLDANKKIMGISGIFRDITERKKAQEFIENSLKEKEVLLREIHHRVKNNMQIISSLLKLQARSITDKKYSEMYRESQNRIVTMSLIHEKLYQSSDISKIEVGGYIKELVDGIFFSYEIYPGKIKPIFDIDNIYLGINSAIPCGLIINELISNSLKYAFPGGRTGEIKISLHSTPDKIFELIVSDNGVGLPADLDFRKTESMGMRMITILVDNQLHGELNIEKENGTKFYIKFKEV